MFPLIIIGAALLAFGFKKQGAILADALNYTPKSFRLNKNGLGLFESKGTMVLNIANNSTVTASVDSIVGTIITNGVVIGRYEILTPFNIPAKNNVDLNVQVFLYNKDFGTAIANLITSGKTPAISLSGDIRTNFGTASFKNQMFNEVKIF